MHWGYEYESHHHLSHLSTFFSLSLSQVFYFPILMMLTMSQENCVSISFTFSFSYANSQRTQAFTFILHGICVTLFKEDAHVCVNMCRKFLMSFSLIIHHINLLFTFLKELWGSLHYHFRQADFWCNQNKGDVYYVTIYIALKLLIRFFQHSNFHICVAVEKPLPDNQTISRVSLFPHYIQQLQFPNVLTGEIWRMKFILMATRSILINKRTRKLLRRDGGQGSYIHTFVSSVTTL